MSCVGLSLGWSCNVAPRNRSCARPGTRVTKGDGMAHGEGGSMGTTVGDSGGNACCCWSTSVQLVQRSGSHIVVLGKGGSVGTVCAHTQRQSLLGGVRATQRWRATSCVWCSGVPRVLGIATWCSCACLVLQFHVLTVLFLCPGRALLLALLVTLAGTKHNLHTRLILTRKTQLSRAKWHSYLLHVPSTDSYRCAVSAVGLPPPTSHTGRR